MSVGTFEPLTAGDILIDLDRGCAYRRGRDLELTPYQFDLLACLATRPGRYYSRGQLHLALWGYDFEDSNRLTMLLTGLRRALGEPCPIHTRRAIGWALRIAPAFTEDGARLHKAGLRR